MCSLVLDLLQVELCVYCPVAGDELTVSVFTDFDTSKLIYSVGIESIGYHSLPRSVMDHL